MALKVLLAVAKGRKNVCPIGNLLNIYRSIYCTKSDNMHSLYIHTCIYKYLGIYVGDN